MSFVFDMDEHVNISSLETKIQSEDLLELCGGKDIDIYRL